MGDARPLSPGREPWDGRDGPRIAVLSDLHLDLRFRHLVREGITESAARDALARTEAPALASARRADLVVLAGDVSDGTNGIRWGAAAFPGAPVIYVAGNHEFYRRRHAELLGQLREAAAREPNVTFLENDETRLVLAGRPPRILGCVLWSDYALHGPGTADASRELASERILDHRRIETGAGSFLQPRDAERLHRASRSWLEAALARPFDGTTVVVTHHAPSSLSVAPQFQGDPLSPAFASDLTDLVVRFAPALWIHGHTHHAVDYRIGATRIVSNPWGYPAEELPLSAAVVEI
ncbi:MAG TPA: metallophosphoesterase [Thermoanaerobaculia bacterium]|nr:metallophosphoesterase [Thermoanaerobaculia bacterium]